MFGIEFEPKLGVGTIITVVVLFAGWFHNWITHKVEQAKRDQIADQTTKTLEKVTTIMDDLKERVIRVEAKVGK